MRTVSPALKTLAFVLLVVTFVVASGCSDTKTVPLVRDVPPAKVLTTGGTSGFSGGGGGGGGGGAPGAGAPGSGSIYVSSVPGGRSILRFRFADTMNVSFTQDIAPASEITGPSTQLRDLGPSLQVDRFTDRLYVLDTGRVLVFNNASSANGDVTPDRVVDLANLIAPVSIALDTSRDVLYVADFSSNAIAVFDSASTLNATPTASRIIAGGVGLDGPRSIFCDNALNRLYVANSFSDNVASFDSAGSASGSVDASRVLTGTNTQLSVPFGMAVDGQGQLFVGNRGTGTITVYPPTAGGNTAPSAVLVRSASGIAFPAELAIADGQTLVVADDLLFSVKTFSALAVANNTGFLVKDITGGNTRLFFPFGLAVDPNR